METCLPSWAVAAARLPVAFAQVREDALLDLEVLQPLGRAVRVLLVASGGCTAAALAGSGRVAHLHLVDPNPSQLALARLKLHLLQTAGLSERLALLGHAVLAPGERRQRLGAVLAALELSPTILGPVDDWAEAGPDHAGRYERVFAELRAALGRRPCDLDALLRLRDPAAQAALIAPATALGNVLDEAFDEVMALPILVHLFGDGATRNRIEPFARHFARRTRHVLATLPAADNPYLWQMLRGRFPDGVVYPWLTMPPPARIPAVTTSLATMAVVLGEHRGAFDVVHLSNILDWLSAEEAATTLELAAAALRPGGVVFVRRLNSTLDIAARGAGFDWQTGPAEALHARDRSFFYRALYLGKKR